MRRKCDAVAGVGPGDDCVLPARAARVPIEYRLPGIPKKNRPAPAVREFYSGQRRMQMTHALLQLRKDARRLGIGYVYGVQVVRVGGVHQSRAPDDRTILAHASPKIGKIHGVERLARGQTDLFEHFRSEEHTSELQS